jgi:thymidylate synthase ThyX
MALLRRDMKIFEGKNGIKATVICDSICNGVRLTTIECEYPRIIHAELLTHRMLSRNAASSRAIPFEKMLKQLIGMPVRFGANQAGMQDSGEHNTKVKGKFNKLLLRHEDSTKAEDAWELAKRDAIFWSKAFSDAGYHKQICNRLTEPFQMIKVLITATEWENFFWLRCDEAADPTLQELARVMKEARDESEPQPLRAGDWHLPYITNLWHGLAQEYTYYADAERTEKLALEDAIKVSAARSAAVSYRNVDYSLDKSKEVYDRLVGAEKKHGSALEHQATPIHPSNSADCPTAWEEGISHADRDGNLWSGNFLGFIQHRKLLSGENYSG